MFVIFSSIMLDLIGAGLMLSGLSATIAGVGCRGGK